MRIVDLLDERSIDIRGSASDKHEVLKKMVELMSASGKIKDVEKYYNGVLKREEEGTTGIGEGIAIPHCKSDAVLRPGLAAMVLSDGVEFESMDGEKVHLIFLIAAPNTKDNVHLDVLGKLSILLMDENFTNKLKNCQSVKEFLNIIDDADDEKKEEEEDSSIIKVLAVTGCPTGIAHTYMAAEGLSKAAKAINIPIKVETRGSSGAKNVLTEDEINKADGIIVAADTKVPMERFNGKQVLEVPVADGIKRPLELINTILENKAPIYSSGASASNCDNDEGRNSDLNNNAATTEGNENRNNGFKTIARGFYKHLMNGVSHMLPFVVAGGLLIAIAFLIDDKTLDPANLGSNTPIAAWFKKMGDYAFYFMLPVLSGYIAMSIGDRPALLPGFVGGYLSLTGPTFMNPSAENAVSPGFLGALLAGFAAGFIVLLVQRVFKILPQSLEGTKPVLLYPLFSTLLICLFMCAVNPIISAINLGLTELLNSMQSTSRILLGCVLGAMMSIDMGGPFNKAAYVFGTGMLAQQTQAGYMIMAAVMVAGMVPPTAVAIATTFFKNRFSEQERKSGPVNYIMGISFITEGAIPYAAADPFRVIPSCVAGAALAGGLSMAFRCTLSAPHGGLFVLAVVGNALGYLIAFVAGAVLGGLLIGILKKPYKET